MVTPYMVPTSTGLLERELKRGSAELLILALLEQRQRHGYEIGRLIDERSDGAITFHVASLYPTLYRLERRGLIQGRWVEKAGTRRRRFYRITAEGQKMLDAQRKSWSAFFAALNRVAGGDGGQGGEIRARRHPAPLRRRRYTRACSARTTATSSATTWSTVRPLVSTVRCAWR